MGLGALYMGQYIYKVRNILEYLTKAHMPSVFLNRGCNLEKISKNTKEEEVNLEHYKAIVARFLLIMSY